MDAETQGSNFGDWFDRINDAALGWYSIWAQNQPAATAGQPAVSVSQGPGSLTASASLPILIVGALVILGAVYVYKKA